MVGTLAVEIHEVWIEAMQYLNMEPLKEQKKGALRLRNIIDREPSIG
jgi:hypothetical protein